MDANGARDAVVTSTRGRLSLVGLGMGSADDITLRGLALARASDVVFLEHYTAVLIDDADTTRLEALLGPGRKVALADRDAVESGAVLAAAEDPSRRHHVTLLVVGDPLSATTHCDLIERCRAKDIAVDVVGNASIITAVGCCGLQLYRYGQIVSVCFWTATWRPAGYFDKVAANRALGLHTLLLLDIKVKEISDENLARGRTIYEPARFMTAPAAARQLLDIERERAAAAATGAAAGSSDGDAGRAATLGVAPADLCVVVVARLGSTTATVVVARLGDLAAAPDSLFGAPLHSLVVPGDVHDCEAEYVLLHPQLVRRDGDGGAATFEIVERGPKAAGGSSGGPITAADLMRGRLPDARRRAILAALADGSLSCA